MKGKSSFHPKRLLSSFRFAGNGLRLALCEPNMRVHIAAGIFISAAGFIFDLTRMEWCVLLLTITGVISLEMVNTAIEKTVDLVTEEYKPLAKMAKDLAAGAVLIFAIAAIIIGGLLFIPKF